MLIEYDCRVLWIIITTLLKYGKSSIDLKISYRDYFVVFLSNSTSHLWYTMLKIIEFEVLMLTHVHICVCVIININNALKNKPTLIDFELAMSYDSMHV